MRIEIYECLNDTMASQWCHFLNNSSHSHPEQYPEFGAATVDSGGRVLYVHAVENDSIVCVALFTLRTPVFAGLFCEASCYSGPVCDSIDVLCRFAQALTKDGRFSTFGFLRLSPYWLGDEGDQVMTALQRQGWRPSGSQARRQTGLIDLTRSEEAIIESFSKSARREIRRAERQGVDVRPIAHADEVKTFLDLLNNLRDERGLLTISERELMSLYELTRSRRAIIVAAYSPSRTLLAGLVLFVGKLSAHARYFAVSNSELRQLSNLRIAPIVWFAGMKWAKDKGCVKLDVEAFNLDASETEQNYRINKYKREFAPESSFRVNDHTFVVRYDLYICHVGLARLRGALRKVTRAGKRLIALRRSLPKSNAADLAS